MPTESERAVRLQDLRRRAEAHLRKQSAEDTAAPGELVHDLRLYQTELELQNQELLLAEQELRKSRDRYVDLYAFAPAGHATLEADGFASEVNRTFAGFLGQSASALLHQRFESWIDPRDQGYYRNLRDDALAGRDRPAARVRLVSADESTTWVDLYSVAIVPADPQPASADSVSTHSANTAQLRIAAVDVTTQKAAEERNQQLEQHLRTSQRFETLGSMAGGVAHDFNNLLQAIFMSTELAQSLLPAESPSQEHLNDVQSAAQRAAELAARMLACTGQQTPERLQVDCLTVIREAAHLVEISLRPNVELQLDLPDRLPPVMGDSTQLFQLVMNLATNAAESIGDSPGKVHMKVKVSPAGADAAIPTAGAYTAALGETSPDSPYAVLEIADDGCGMDHDTVQRIFDPFFTTKFTGRGLGLATALGIVRSHHGAIRVWSHPNAGTRFSIHLPLCDEQPGQPQRIDADPAADSVEKAGGAVFLLGRPGIEIHALRRSLEILGFAVAAAENLDASIPELNDLTATVDCVIYDVEESTESCWATIDHLRSNCPDLPLVIYCSDENAFSQLVANPDEPTYMLEKPFRTRELRALMRAIADPETR